MTKVITDDEDILTAIKGQRAKAIRIYEGIVTQIIFENGTVMTGSMITEAKS